jgi:hypothetical protein
MVPAKLLVSAVCMCLCLCLVCQRYLVVSCPAAASSNFNQRLWGCHLPFGVHIDLITSMTNLEGLCQLRLSPRYPRPPGARTPVVISTKLTSRLSLAPCCAGQPSFGHIQAAPRRALAPVGSSPGLVIWPAGRLAALQLRVTAELGS